MRVFYLIVSVVVLVSILAIISEKKGYSVALSAVIILVFLLLDLFVFPYLLFRLSLFLRVIIPKNTLRLLNTVYKNTVYNNAEATRVISYHLKKAGVVGVSNKTILSLIEARDKYVHSSKGVANPQEALFAVGKSMGLDAILISKIDTGESSYLKQIGAIK